MDCAVTIASVTIGEAYWSIIALSALGVSVGVAAPGIAKAVGVKLPVLVCTAPGFCSTGLHRSPKWHAKVGLRRVAIDGRRADLEIAACVCIELDRSGVRHRYRKLRCIFRQ